MSIPEYTLANKTKYPRDAAFELLGDVTKIYAAKRGKTVMFKASDISGDSEGVAKAILGPTGNLRAPAIRMGKTLVVGFEAEMYGSLFD